MIPAVLRLSCLVEALLAAPFAMPAVRAQESSPASSKAVSAALQPLVDSHCLAGAVTLVADKDKILSQNAVGYADIAASKPMTTDALFWIASQSKPITATALMMLVDEGKVALDDPVEKYLPEFHHQWLTVEHDNAHILLKQPKRPITVRDILSHTSGLPFTSAAEQPTLDLLPLRVGVLSYAMTPLVFEPGSKYQYSNAGINTAGRIIEVESGMPYEEFLETRLFRPLGMNDTTFWPSSEQVSRLAKSYKPGKNGSGLRGDDRHPAQVPAQRPHAPAHARGRPLLDGPRPRAVLPDDLERRGLRGQALSVPGSGDRDDPQANPRSHQGWLRPGLGHGRRLIRPRRGLFHQHDDR